MARSLLCTFLLLSAAALICGEEAEKIFAPNGAKVHMVANLHVPQAEETTYAILAESLLGKEKAVAYYGDIRPEEAAKTCALLETSTKSLKTFINVKGQEMTLTFTIDKVSGCPGPNELQAVLHYKERNEPTRKILVVCASDAEKSGKCNAYVAGDDIEEMHSELVQESDLYDDLDFAAELVNSLDNDEYEDYVMIRQLKGLDLGQAIKIVKQTKEMIEGKPAKGPTVCFPGAAQVTVQGVGLVRMDSLKVGDQVLSINAEGRPFYDAVYFFGHKDAQATAPFIKLAVQTAANITRTLHLSAQHFVPAGHVTKYAKHVHVGDKVTVLAGDVPVTGVVTKTTVVVKKGLYNPYTKGGFIVVDGLLASAHSDWILDAITPTALTIYLPAVYQVLFKPLYFLYALAGPAAATAFNDRVVLPLSDVTTCYAALTAVVAATIVALRKAKKTV